MKLRADRHLFDQCHAMADELRELARQVDGLAGVVQNDCDVDSTSYTEWLHNARDVSSKLRERGDAIAAQILVWRRAVAYLADRSNP